MFSCELPVPIKSIFLLANLLPLLNLTWQGKVFPSLWFQFPHPRQHLLCFFLVITAIRVDVNAASVVVLTDISLVADNVGHLPIELFIYLLQKNTYSRPVFIF